MALFMIACGTVVIAADVAWLASLYLGISLSVPRFSPLGFDAPGFDPDDVWGSYVTNPLNGFNFTFGTLLAIFAFGLGTIVLVSGVRMRRAELQDRRDEQAAIARIQASQGLNSESRDH